MVYIVSIEVALITFGEIKMSPFDIGFFFIL